MVDRLLLWLGAAVVAGGVTVGMLAAAGTANAQTESDGDGGAKTSQSAKPADNEQDSSRTDTSAAPDAKPRFGRDAVKAINAVKEAVNDAVTKVVRAAGDSDRATVAESNVRTTVTPEPGQRAAKLVNNLIAAVTHQPDRKVVIDRTRQTDPVEKVDTVDSVETESTNVATLEQQQGEVVRTDVVNRLAAFAPKRTDLTLATPMLAQPQAAAAASPQIDVPPVISAIGTAVFGLISLAESVIEGPPKALPGSGVTVKRSTLKIGDQEVPADWYFPDTYDADSATPPERIIYLQHGFLARGVFYDYTASYLAQQTNSVVVAPTLRSNIFATDGMWLGGDPMHRAVADLFNDDNDELLKSASAAGYKQDQLPQDVVLIGHSLGGGLVIDVARYMAENGTSDKLAGVVMLDGVAFTDPVPILEDIPDSIPVYNLSGTPYFWDLFGSMDHALAEVRGDDFHGAQLLGGLHSDAMIGGNPLVQFGAYLFTGYGGPANVAGSQVLAAGWINDLFECHQGPCTPDPDLYGEPGSTIQIPTPVGPAFGVVQPTQGPITTVGRELTAVFLGLLGHINFAADVDSTQTDTTQTDTTQTMADQTLAAPTAVISTAKTIAPSSTGQIPIPRIVSAVGTAVFNLLALTESVIEGPPKALPGSGVTVTRSTLSVGDQEVPADWYFPSNATPPDGIIYLQHGFGARGVFYDYTASYLAQQTNSIVVAPTLSSNLFATDGMWLGGDQMDRAVADLFKNGNTALLASAQRAGFSGDALPTDVVLVGHSTGGGVVINIARFMAADDAAGTSSYHLKGVLMLDGVAANNDPAPLLAEIPPTIPVYNLSSTPAPFNLFGAMDAALADMPGDSFHGAQLVGGWHTDAMVGGNPLVRFAGYLLTGFSAPRNVEGSQILAAAWINDMFEGDLPTGDPGSTITIPTSHGDATAVVAPTPGFLTSVLREVTTGFIGLGSLFDFTTDVDETANPLAASGAPAIAA